MHLTVPGALTSLPRGYIYEARVQPQQPIQWTFFYWLDSPPKKKRLRVRGKHRIVSNTMLIVNNHFSGTEENGESPACT